MQRIKQIFRGLTDFEKIISISLVIITLCAVVIALNSDRTSEIKNEVIFTTQDNTKHKLKGVPDVQR